MRPYLVRANQLPLVFNTRMTLASPVESETSFDAIKSVAAHLRSKNILAIPPEVAAKIWHEHVGSLEAEKWRHYQMRKLPPVIPAPQWLKDRWAKVRAAPPPSIGEVRQYFKASASHGGYTRDRGLPGEYR